MLPDEYVHSRVNRMRRPDRDRFMERVYLIRSAVENESIVKFFNTFTIWEVYDALVIEHEAAMDFLRNGPILMVSIQPIVQDLCRLLKIYRSVMVDRMHGTIDPMMSPHWEKRDKSHHYELARF